ncbi:hypothetical protein DV735_g5229, partial [Chaetothyriales sp. CBS 134920]
MAVPPKFAGQILLAAAPPAATTTTAPRTPTTPHTLELYLDYVCPFSAKLFNTFYNHVYPTLATAKYSSPGIRVIFRQQIQPWHPSSTLVHEAGVAVLRTAPDRFWEFSRVLFERQQDFFDVNVVNEARNQTYARLAKLAASVDGGAIDEGKILSLLTVADKPGPDGGLNGGNGTTNDIKVLVKINRLTGVHVTPTVVWDGVVENSISSGWTKEQWDEWLDKNAH